MSDVMTTRVGLESYEVMAKHGVFDYEKDFYDDMHTTPLGSEKIGKYLYEKLKHLNFLTL